jgi:hypothetical protein
MPVSKTRKAYFSVLSFLNHRSFRKGLTHELARRGWNPVVRLAFRLAHDRRRFSEQSCTGHNEWRMSAFKPVQGQGFQISKPALRVPHILDFRES